MITIASHALAISLLAGLGEAQDQAYRWWAPQHRDRQAAMEQALLAVPSAGSLRAWHDLLAAEPHLAGTAGDQRVIGKLVDAFTTMGLPVQTHEIWPLLARPIQARVAIVMAPATDKPEPEAALPIVLPLQEAAPAEDSSAVHADLTIGWNAYSGSGDVTGEVVYANYGRQEDFQKLAELGVEVRGKIVMARYGKLFRGYKVKFAEEAGALGVLLYTDPADSGYVQGIEWPEGGWANETMIQRGSLLTLDYPGDPLTPGTEATKDAARLEASAVALPTIPVQPLGWSAAQKILARMRGPSVPREPESWQGGLPLAYRLEGGPKLLVRMMVRQERALTRTANVMATLPGSTWPEQAIIIGCHHDAWGFGAADPLAGTIVLMEAARSLGEVARLGHRPQRTIIFAAWGAEEFGIIGSTEWCEANEATMRDGAVAYVNLDMAAMGRDFQCAASPTLRALIDEVTRAVPQAGDAQGRSVHEVTLAHQRRAARGPTDQPPAPGDAVPAAMQFGSLGGGSDHVAFLCRLGVPACSIGAGGAQGTSYHSNYDHLGWYRKVVGDDYEAAVMLARVVALLAARLANADVLPLDATAYAPDVRAHLKTIGARADELRVALDNELLLKQLTELDDEAALTARLLDQAIESGRLDAATLTAINRALLSMERSWLTPEGLPGRPWYRSIYAGTDPNRGYDAWMLPLLRWGVETRNAKAANWTVGIYMNAVQWVGERLGEVRAVLSPAGTPTTDR